MCADEFSTRVEGLGVQGLGFRFSHHREQTVDSANEAVGHGNVGGLRLKSQRIYVPI